MVEVEHLEKFIYGKLSTMLKKQKLNAAKMNRFTETVIDYDKIISLILIHK